ncbi:MAG TPA: gamma-glutamylcyclotransferase family protein [Xanthobacteraceae bacterium]|nr:gamma-glutamylcyclotransferase family protein [Xanthobacteraceae bacterium]
MLHFAYGSNMHRAVMRKHAPQAVPVGIATLADYRFIITGDGYATVAPAAKQCVHGLVWRITPQDRVTLDAWENLAAGLYRAEVLPVHHAGEDSPALVYIARECPAGQPRAGYMELVIEAARALELPPDYIASLAQWLPKGPVASAQFGDFG